MKFLATMFAALFAPLALFAGELTMTGTGSVSLPADTAYITLTVSTEHEKPANALAMNSESTNRVFASLEKLGLKKSEIQTHGLRLTPTYTYVKDQEAKLKGYVVSHTIQVTVCNIADTGKVMDAVVKDGANRVDGVSFDISEEKRADALKLTRKQAALAAMEKVELYCNVLGIKTREVKSLSEYTERTGVRTMYMADRASGPGGRPSTNVEGGQIQVSTTVTVVWDTK